MLHAHVLFASIEHRHTPAFVETFCTLIKNTGKICELTAKFRHIPFVWPINRQQELKKSINSKIYTARREDPLG